MKRIESSGERWHAAYRQNGICQLQDTRRFNTGKPSEPSLSIEEKYEKLQAKIKLLQAQNELLKKLEMLERSVSVQK